jgi:hypothetical protein
MWWQNKFHCHSYKGFCEKKEPKSLVIEEIIFQITIFKP